jgi:hypothetical protein
MCLCLCVRACAASSFRLPLAQRSVLPGTQAYGTARDVASALRAVTAGKVLGATTLTDALRSRQPAASALSKPTRMPAGTKLLEVR